jgi:VCBS repeat-containing protein
MFRYFLRFGSSRRSLRKTNRSVIRLNFEQLEDRLTPAAPIVSANPATETFIEVGDAHAQNLSTAGTVSFTDADNDLIDIQSFYNGDIHWDGGIVGPALRDQLTSGTFTATATDAVSGGNTPWTYTANGVDLDFLRDGQTIQFSFTIVANDGNEVGTDKVTIALYGMNDKPTLFIPDTTGDLVVDSTTSLTTSGPLIAADVDADSVVTVSQTFNNDVLWTGGPLDAGLAATLVAGFSVDQDSWDYSTNADLSFMNIGETISFSFNVVATDETNITSDPTKVSITLTCVNIKPTLTIGDTSGDLNEGDGTATLTTSAALSFVDLNGDGVTVSQTSNNDIVWSGGSLDAGVAANLVAGFSVDQDSWDYSAAENLDFLRSGETITFSFNVVATDDSGAINNTSDPTMVTITITGTNDKPTLTTGATGALTEGDGTATLMASNSLTPVDLDLNDVVTVTKSSNGDIVWSGGTLAPALAAALVAGFSVDQDSWDYTTSANLDFLRKDQTITFSFNVAATDNSGAVNNASDATKVTIAITGANDKPTLTIGNTSGALTEGDGTATLSTSGTLSFLDPDSANVTVSKTSNGDIAWTGGTLAPALAAALVAGFSVDQDSWDYSTSANLDFVRRGETITFSFNVVATDDSGASNSASDPTKVTITITGSNDKPTLTIGTTSGGLTEGDGTATLTASAALSFADLDTNDVVTVSKTSNNDIVWSGGTLAPALATALVSGFSVDQNSWDYSTNANLDFLRRNETIAFSFNVVATDNSGASNNTSTATKVTITITGSNDRPTLTIGTTSGGLTEGNGTATLTASAALSFADLDTSDVVTVSKTPNNDIAWSGGTLAPAIATALVAGFSVDQNSWDYSTNANLDFLRKNETIIFSFNVVATDNSGGGNNTSTATKVTLTITGTNDNPTVSATAAAGFTEDTDASAQDLTDNGTVTFDDIDANDTITISAAYNADIVWSGGTLAGPLVTKLTSGTFVASATNAAAPGSTPWTYTANDVPLDFLAGGQTITFSFTVTANDGTSTATDKVTITITGTNDVPTLTAVAAPVDTTNEDTEVELTFADLTAQGNEADVDGTVAAFVVQTVSSGTLKIGTNPGSATAFAAGSNDTIDATHNAYWTPALNANGTAASALAAFTVVAQDNAGGLSASPLTVKVNVTPVNDAPTLTTFAAALDTTDQDTTVELTFVEVSAQGNEADLDGTVTAFVVQAVSSGDLKIGASAATAAPFAAGTNDTIDATHNAYWTPAANANGPGLAAFTVRAKDDAGATSAGDVAVQVNVNPITFVYIDFGNNGFWRYSPQTGYQMVHPHDVETFSVGADGFVYIDFGNLGLWRWSQPAGFEQLHAANAENVVAGADGFAYIDFGNFGFWRWSPATGYQQLHAANVENYSCGTDGFVYVDFGPFGLWRWSQPTGYQQIHAANPENVVAGSDGFTYVDFGNFGFWRWSQATGFHQLHAANVEGYSVGGDGFVYIDFGVHGLWRWSQATSYQFLHAANIDEVAAGGGAFIYIDFGSGGLSRWSTATGFQQIHPMSPQGIRV